MILNIKINVRIKRIDGSSLILLIIKVPISILKLREKLVAKISPIRRQNSSNNPLRNPIAPVVIIKKIVNASRN